MEIQDVQNIYLNIENLIPTTIAGGPPPVKLEEMGSYGDIDLIRNEVSLIVDQSKIESAKETIKQAEKDISILRAEIECNNKIIKAKEELIKLLSTILGLK